MAGNPPGSQLDNRRQRQSVASAPNEASDPFTDAVMAQDRYRARRNRLLTAVKQAEIDAVLIAHPPNVRYLTGFTGEDSQLMIGPKHTVLISDSRFTTQIAQECPG